MNEDEERDMDMCVYGVRRYEPHDFELESDDPS